MPPKKKGRQRRPKGTGGFFWSESKQVYIARVIVGKKPDGSPHYVERSDPTEAGLVKKLEEVAPPSSGITLKAWLERWLKSLEGTELRQRTKDVRKTATDLYFVPTLGHIRLTDLTHLQITEAVKKWTATLKSASTRRTYLAALSTALNAAKYEGLITDNPILKVKRPPQPKAVFDPFTVADLNRIIADAVQRPATYPCALYAATGCRMGEALALDVTSFDPAAGTIAITQTQDARRERGPAKTSNSIRVIEVPADARPALVSAIGTRTDGPLFTTPAGRRQSKSNVRKAWIRLLNRLGLKYRAPHKCRHTVATRMLAAGYGIPDVAAYLGDTAETVLRIYARPSGASVGAGMQALLDAAKPVP
ncbi:Tyrosine recombinase XerC [Gemmata obscuriglobus]|uniref:Site-specific integrase n=1 Tax=Gemmata obscuriglobus TaxID=114 RepID=A0A2Z3H503_9BACT|nr:site-specific integrase [Gemmata obscuriglobus]AWM38195.1 site-specific integrase [Gemmata obscuriglobus]QEG28903.1 Tyrosine recombinase XerC [Gemmata obscuriglobus]VTS07377.1 integrase : Integrase OS=Pseudomonas sp. WCS358 GN=PC358_06340 PE=4 SV=1: Phage_int_SAM_3: Phage_integrase [Gemmata obscuriglobus UQM 2246]